MSIIKEQIPIHKKWLWFKSNIPFKLITNYNDEIEKAPGTWKINTWELLPEQYHKNNPVFMLYIEYDSEYPGVINPYVMYSLTDLELSAIDSGEQSFTSADLNETNSLIDSVDTNVELVKDSVDTVKTSVDTVKTSVDTVKTSVDTVKTSVDSVKTSVDSVKTSVDSVGNKIDNGFKGLLQNENKFIIFFCGDGSTVYSFINNFGDVLPLKPSNNNNKLIWRTSLQKFLTKNSIDYTLLSNNKLQNIRVNKIEYDLTVNGKKYNIYFDEENNIKLLDWNEDTSDILGVFADIVGLNGSDSDNIQINIKILKSDFTFITRDNFLNDLRFAKAFELKL